MASGSSSPSSTSKTHRPAHHDFGSEIFDPRLEAGIDPAVLQEPEELDSRYPVVVYIDSPTDNRFWVARLDGTRVIAA